MSSQMIQAAENHFAQDDFRAGADCAKGANSTVWQTISKIRGATNTDIYSSYLAYLDARTTGVTEKESRTPIDRPARRGRRVNIAVDTTPNIIYDRPIMKDFTKLLTKCSATVEEIHNTTDGVANWKLVAKNKSKISAAASTMTTDLMSNWDATYKRITDGSSDFAKKRGAKYIILTNNVKRGKKVWTDYVGASETQERVTYTAEFIQCYINTAMALRVLMDTFSDFSKTCSGIGTILPSLVNLKNLTYALRIISYFCTNCHLFEIAKVGDQVKALHKTLGVLFNWDIFRAIADPNVEINMDGDFGTVSTKLSKDLFAHQKAMIDDLYLPNHAGHPYDTNPHVSSIYCCNWDVGTGKTVMTPVIADICLKKTAVSGVVVYVAPPIVAVTILAVLEHHEFKTALIQPGGRMTPSYSCNVDFGVTDTIKNSNTPNVVVCACEETARKIFFGDISGIVNVSKNRRVSHITAETIFKQIKLVNKKPTAVARRMTIILDDPSTELLTKTICVDDREKCQWSNRNGVILMSATKLFDPNHSTGIGSPRMASVFDETTGVYHPVTRPVIYSKPSGMTGMCTIKYLMDSDDVAQKYIHIGPIQLFSIRAHLYGEYYESMSLRDWVEFYTNNIATARFITPESVLEFIKHSANLVVYGEKKLRQYFADHFDFSYTSSATVLRAIVGEFAGEIEKNYVPVVKCTLLESYTELQSRTYCSKKRFARHTGKTYYARESHAKTLYATNTENCDDMMGGMITTTDVMRYDNHTLSEYVGSNYQVANIIKSRKESIMEVVRYNIDILTIERNAHLMSTVSDKYDQFCKVPAVFSPKSPAHKSAYAMGMNATKLKKYNHSLYIDLDCTVTGGTKVDLKMSLPSTQTVENLCRYAGMVHLDTNIMSLDEMITNVGLLGTSPGVDSMAMVLRDIRGIDFDIDAIVMDAPIAEDGTSQDRAYSEMFYQGLGRVGRAGSKKTVGVAYIHNLDCLSFGFVRPPRHT